MTLKTLALAAALVVGGLCAPASAATLFDLFSFSPDGKAGDCVFVPELGRYRCPWQWDEPTEGGSGGDGAGAKDKPVIIGPVGNPGYVTPAP